MAISRAGAGGLLCLFCGFGLGIKMETKAAPQNGAIPEIIQAQRFQIVEKDGTSRIQMGVDSEGGARVDVWDRGHRQSVSLGMDGRGNGTISLKDSSGTERASFLVSEERGAALALAGANRQPIAALAALPDGSLALSMLSAQKLSDGKLVKGGAILYVSPEGRGEIKLYDKKGKEKTIAP